MVTKQRALGLAILVLGIALTTAILAKDEAIARWSGPWQHALLAVGIMLGLAGIMVLWTSLFNERSAAGLRIDWFLHFLRKKKQKETLKQPTVIKRIAKTFLPGFLFSDPLTGKPGRIRKSLKRVSTSLLSSPWRRLSQTACFLLFMYSFFYVLWPYTAKPAPPGRVATDWRFEELDQELGQYQLSNTDLPDWVAAHHSSVHVVDQSYTDPAEGYIGSFEVANVTDGSISLASTGDATGHFDSFLTSNGPWALHEVEPGKWPSHYADDFAGKESFQAELFLTIDPLVSLSTAIASRSWVWSLVSAAVILIVCVAIPRGFCGYLCPLGTLIDLFDWLIAGRVKKIQIPDNGWWVHVKYYLLIGTLVCALFGVLVSGYVAAIPVITRGMLFIGEPLQSGSMRGWHLVPPVHFGHILSIGLFLAVLCLGFFRQRFWCKYVCPSGAVFSIANLFRVTERKVESSCINCNKCVEICPFDAIKPDFTTRTADCTLCQTCGGVCPTHAIKFVDRWNLVELKIENDPPTGETSLGRRGFLSMAAGTAAAVAGGAVVSTGVKAFGATTNEVPLVRPPGSVPEKEFLEMCIRCGECFKACPNNVLQAEGFEQGLEGLWAPLVNADWAGCESSCNACGQVCPTGAIRALPLEEKKVARMGLAVVNQQTCLPFAGVEACDLCVQECNAAGYEAIEYIQVGTELDENGVPLDNTGFLAPVVLSDKCVGCGLCQTRCYAINVKEKDLLDESAIIVEAGSGKEDRIMNGSYIELRQQEAAERKRSQQFSPPTNPKPSSNPPTVEPAVDDPFGIGSPEPQLDDDPFGLD